MLENNNNLNDQHLLTMRQTRYKALHMITRLILTSLLGRTVVQHPLQRKSEVM